jgi:hypothetical protein
LKYQQDIIDTQGKRIDDLLTMMKEMKESTESKIDSLLKIMTEMTMTPSVNTSKNDSDKEFSKQQASKRRP